MVFGKLLKLSVKAAWGITHVVLILVILPIVLVLLVIGGLIYIVLAGGEVAKELKRMVGTDETVLYEGKPDKRCFIFESILNPLLPIAIVWAVFDAGFFGVAMGHMQFIMIPFLLFHMMPVWIYSAGVIFSFRKYKNTYYIVTDHAVYISSGIFTMNLEMKTFAELSRVNLHRGIFDQMFHVGDVQITTNQFTRNNMPAVLGINNISDYAEVYQLVKKLQKDIYSDTMYPNDLRPEENHGYKTKYRSVIERLRQEERVEKFVLLFLKDDSYPTFIQAFEKGDVECAFRAVHTLKGVCMNLSFDTLYHIASGMIEALRNADLCKAAELLPEFITCYERHIQMIGSYVNKSSVGEECL